MSDASDAPTHGGGNGFWISMAVLLGLGLFIGSGFLAAYFLV